MTRIWQGTTPAGYPLVVDRDLKGRWVVTVAAAMRSRNSSLETALMEASGSAHPHEWATQLAALIATTPSRPVDGTQAATA